MKKLASFVLLSLIFAIPALAKGASGGQLPTAPASSLDQPALIPSGTSAPSTSSSGAPPTSSSGAPPTSSSGAPPTSSSGALPEAKKPEVKPAEKAPEKAKEQPAPAILKGKKHCGELGNLADRVKCRLNVGVDVLKQELTTAYLPEGCRRGKPEWQEACKKRYKAIGPCWYLEETKGDKYPADKIYSCLKKELKLADKLKPSQDYCKGKDASCAEEYKKSIYNLIISRFYDAEQRAEDLLNQGRLSKDDTANFIVFISQKKLAFYDAKTKTERQKIIQDVSDEWKKLLKKVK